MIKTPIVLYSGSLAELKTGDSIVAPTITSHSDLNNLDADDHTQYALLNGRSSGQKIIGGINASEDLILDSTSNTTKGNIIFNSNLLPNANDTIIIGSEDLSFNKIYTNAIYFDSMISPTYNQGFDVYYSGSLVDGTLLSYNATLQKWENVLPCKVVSTIRSQTITNNYTMTENDLQCMYYISGSANVIFILDNAETNQDRKLTLKNSGETEVFISGSHGNLIDGNNDRIITENLSLTIHASGSNWYII